MKEPLPAEAKKSGDSFEDTMLLLDIVREKKKKQNENKKVTQSLFCFLIVNGQKHFDWNGTRTSKAMFPCL